MEKLDTNSMNFSRILRDISLLVLIFFLSTGTYCFWQTKELIEEVRREPANQKQKVMAGNDYFVKVTRVRVKDTYKDEDGNVKSWDTNSLPDIYTLMRQKGKTSRKSKIKDDCLTARWHQVKKGLFNLSVDIDSFIDAAVITAGSDSEISLDILDDDTPLSDDKFGTLKFNLQDMQTGINKLNCSHSDNILEVEVWVLHYNDAPSYVGDLFRQMMINKKSVSQEVSHKPKSE